jgi:hypothetical protein
MKNTKQVYEPGLWKSYSTEDRVDFLIECGCKRVVAEDYSYRDFASLPLKIRESIEALEHFVVEADEAEMQRRHKEDAQ